MLIRISCLALILFLPVGRLAAWGDEGHRIVGEIAWKNLATETKREVRKLLPEGEYSTLFEAATWPDRYARSRVEYNWAKPLHYINVEPEAEAVDYERHCPEKKCVVGAIIDYAHILKNPTATSSQKIEALRFLAHFVGDIHQPLHVSHRDGRGGNLTKVTFNGREVKLHAFWDSTFFEEYLRQLGSLHADEMEPDYSGVSWDYWAKELLSSISESDRVAWGSQLDPILWANESLRLAKEHTFSIEDGMILQEEYFDTSIKVVSRRLQQAGVRLAALLNNIFSTNELPF